MNKQMRKFQNAPGRILRGALRLQETFRPVSSCWQGRRVYLSLDTSRPNGNSRVTSSILAETPRQKWPSFALPIFTMTPGDLRQDAPVTARWDIYLTHLCFIDATRNGPVSIFAAEPGCRIEHVPIGDLVKRKSKKIRICFSCNYFEILLSLVSRDTDSRSVDGT